MDRPRQSQVNKQRGSVEPFLCAGMDHRLLPLVPLSGFDSVVWSTIMFPITTTHLYSSVPNTH